MPLVLLRSLSFRLLAVLACAPCIAGAAAPPDDMTKRVAPCMACHGKEGRATSDGYYPRIAGKPAGYLHNQLLNFRDGRRRQYPLMTYLVQHLSDDYLREMATWFSAQHLPYPPPQPIDASPAMLERGRMLALEGDPSKDIPACASCHGKTLTGVAPAVPGLLGLPRDYLNGQFGAWREGSRRAATPDCMAEITQRLSVEDISAVSAWLATQPVPSESMAANAFPGRVPIDCGSIPK